MTLQKALKPLFFLTTIYSFLALSTFAEKTAGACNAGIALMGIGFFLILCAVLTFIAVHLVTKSKQTDTSRKAAKVLSIIALVIWGFWTVGICTNEPLAGAAYFLPFLITVIITCRLAYTETPVQSEN